MATITVTPRKTFTSGEVITPAKLSDAANPTATIDLTGAIVDADISATAAIASTKLSTATQQALLPAGAVMPFAMNSAPAGWLAANGDAVSRSTYAALFAAIGTTHGTGDGSTTFNLPDLRGYFIRGAGTNSDGTASGTFALKQEDALKSHQHTYQDYTPSAGQVGVMGGVNLIWQASLATPLRSTEFTGGTETRPANIALLYCIKF